MVGCIDCANVCIVKQRNDGWSVSCVEAMKRCFA